LCYAAARKESGPDLTRIEAGSSGLPNAQGFPPLLERKRAPHAITLQITFDFSALLSREHIPGLGESIGS